ncbi:5-(carboxyamino)imidazole ribonucleotide synthase [Metabacillus arenae]|uniref:N5-carboxyaminoimidazole ribonucleotide synthase n=1 Tax=Metabacillus arenae TaxID=2771434 RepID=A0A926NJS3_9BACI|nr:5-(carboxyamino)imidazole ribonucleotide synthase [Metabacillus arenae]MBD1382360.1 5-(carboxyamino)imidazole ribonucleotide synthase [Metabacillus arenae]
MIYLNRQISPGSTIGIIGGGQLGRFMAIAAKNMGYNVAVLDPTPDSPCGQVSDIEITSPFHDLEGIKRLADVSDVITYEFENIDYEALRWIEKNTYLPQGSQLLLQTQDRKTEKQAITNAGCRVVPYQVVRSQEELTAAIQKIGLPSVLKTCRGGYDGKGQYVLKTIEDQVNAQDLLKSGECVLEKWLPFDKEISVIVTRSSNGETKTFPVAENIHRNNILYQSILPARIQTEVAEEAEQMAIQLANKMDLVGTLAVEMFLTKENEIFINELAPRPHNSGHYSLDLSITSQFEQHVRAVCGLPLGSTALLQTGVMVNLLGQDLNILEENFSLLKDAKLYLYGKKEAKTNRKMGHMTFLTEAIEQTEKKINELFGVN